LRYCRPLISVGSTYLYEQFIRKFFITIAFDTNNVIFPLSFALLKKETNYKWTWFLHCIWKYIIGGCTGICKLSYRHMVIKKNAIVEIWPEFVKIHQYCSHHFVKNFGIRFKDLILKNILDVMCDETSKWKTDTWLGQIIEKDPWIKKWQELKSKETK